MLGVDTGSITSRQGHWARDEYVQPIPDAFFCSLQTVGTNHTASDRSPVCLWGPQLNPQFRCAHKSPEYPLLSLRWSKPQPKVSPCGTTARCSISYPKVILSSLASSSPWILECEQQNYRKWEGIFGSSSALAFLLIPPKLLQCSFPHSGEHFYSDYTTEMQLFNIPVTFV